MDIQPPNHHEGPLNLAQRGLILLARAYQLTLSRWLGGQCKFYPTCSRYFVEAVQRRGAAMGLILGLWRIVRCNPFGKGGYDPVPQSRRYKGDSPS